MKKLKNIISKEKMNLIALVLISSILNAILLRFIDPYVFSGFKMLFRIVVISAISFLLSIIIYANLIVNEKEEN